MAPPFEVLTVREMQHVSGLSSALQMTDYIHIQYITDALALTLSFSLTDVIVSVGKLLMCKANHTYRLMHSIQ